MNKPLQIDDQQNDKVTLLTDTSLQQTNQHLINILEKIDLSSAEYYQWLSNLKHLTNKIDFVDTENSYPIRPGVMNIIDAVEKDGFPYTIDRYGYYMWIKLPNGRSRQVFDYDYGINENAVIHRIFDDKIICSELLTYEGIPNPRSFLLVKDSSSFSDYKNNTASAMKFAASIGYPLILKPVDGSQGRGVVKITTEGQLIEELQKFNGGETGASLRMLQEFSPGNDIRVIYLNGNIELAYQRVPAHITGDGNKTINELLEEKNIEDNREIVIQYIINEGKKLDDVPGVGEKIQIVPTANISTGGYGEKYPFDEEDVAFIENIAHKTGAKYFGADIITKGKISEGTVLELNKMPGTVGASKVEPGFGKKLAAKIWDYIKEYEGI